MTGISIEQALQIAHIHYGAGRLAEAEAVYRNVLAADPSRADACYQVGLIALTTGRMNDARDMLAKAAALAPAEAAYHADLGVACWQLGLKEESVAEFQRALALRPDMAHVHRNLGDAYHGMGRSDEAIESYRRAIAILPGYAHAHSNFGNVWLAMRRIEDAAACYRRAADLDPGFLEATCNLGDALTKLDRLDEALEWCQRAIRLNPNFAGGHLNLGVVYYRMGDFGRAMDSYRRAIACDPQHADSHLSLGLLLMLTGRYEEGLREYEWRWRSDLCAGRARDFAAPRWDGSPIPRQTLLVHADQGFGDTIHFLRYLPLVRERSRAARVILECQPELTRLIAATPGHGVGVFPKLSRDGAELPPFDRHIPLLSLPLALEIWEPVPMRGPYLFADATLRTMWRERLRTSAKMRVGLAWAGSPAHDDDHRRSCPFEKFLPVIRVPGAAFYSLQIQPRQPLPPELTDAGLIDLSAHITDFTDTAALLAELDLVIAVDTATVHLAGALGRPVWTLLSFIPDWRWGMGREDTPWYPTMRLFRQPTAGDWDSVIQRVADELRRASS